MKNLTSISNTSHPNQRTLAKRIGSTTYLVNVIFNPNEKQTMEDKLMRIIRNEALKSKAQ